MEIKHEDKDNKSKSLKMKELGNAAFSKGDFETAIKHFTSAIALDPTNYVLFSNRSAAYAKNGMYEESLQDAKNTISTNPEWPKGHMRLGTSYTFLDKHEEAAKAYSDVLDLDMTHHDARTSLASAKIQIHERVVSKEMELSSRTYEGSTPIVLPDGAWVTLITPFTLDNCIDWFTLDQLVDFHVSRGTAGIFTVCLSSEMYHLTDEERLRLARRVVCRAAGRVSVIAGGNFGDDVDAQSSFVKKMYNTGVDAVVLITSLLAAKGEGDDTLKANCMVILENTDNIPLGLYECPKPYHRLLSPELLKWALDTGRFYFLKDTCCTQSGLTAKLKVVKSDPSHISFKLYNANVATLHYSLTQGASGYCGIAGNVYPHLFVWLCKNYADSPEEANLLQKFLTVAEMTVASKYPHTAKLYLRLFENNLRGIEILCRNSTNTFNEEEMLQLQALNELVLFTKQQLVEEKKPKHAKPILM